MDAFYFYTYGTASWLATQALPLILVPKVINSLLSSEAHVTTDLELYFSRALGISLLTISLIVLFFTGSIPLSATPPTNTASPQLADPDPRSPYTTPILYVTTLHHFLSLLTCYSRYLYTSQIGYALGATGYGFFCAVGIWCAVFGATEFKRSKRTGADKRMAGWPFGNVNAYNKRRDRKVG